jgi:hypothetical protein
MEIRRCWVQGRQTETHGLGRRMFENGTFLDNEIIMVYADACVVLTGIQCVHHPGHLPAHRRRQGKHNLRPTERCAGSAVFPRQGRKVSFLGVGIQLFKD